MKDGYSVEPATADDQTGPGMSTIDRQDGAGVYRLVIRGELGDRFAVQFEGMKLTRAGGTTVLTGELADQAQLVGLIQQAQELGLEIESVERVGSGQGG